MNKIPITVFIHGTLPPQTLLKIPLVKRFFHCPEGLTSLTELEDSHIKDLLTTLCRAHPEKYPPEHCSTFGWSGELNHTARMKSAVNLYKELISLKKNYLKKGIEPAFTLLTHSHGGNVALCLKHIAEQHDDQVLSIDKLILLACPVQIETADAIDDSLFKTVFSLHSHHDLLQVMDPQGLHTFLQRLKAFGLEFTLTNLKELGPLFSERHFQPTTDVKQMNVRYPHRGLLHLEFILPSFFKALPHLIEQLKEHKTEHELIYTLSTEPNVTKDS